MTKEKLQLMEKDEVLKFIRKRLSFDEKITSQFRHVDKEALQKEHRRFEMSGYEGKTGKCTKHNIEIVNKFANLGIYDYTSYLFLDFHKGTGTLYYQDFGNANTVKEEELGGYTTSDIIYKIFEKTIFFR